MRVDNLDATSMNITELKIQAVKDTWVCIENQKGTVWWIDTREIVLIKLVNWFIHIKLRSGADLNIEPDTDELYERSQKECWPEEHYSEILTREGRSNSLKVLQVIHETMGFPND